MMGILRDDASPDFAPAFCDSATLRLFVEDVVNVSCPRRWQLGMSKKQRLVGAKTTPRCLWRGVEAYVMSQDMLIQG